MSVSLLEVIEAAGYDLTTEDDARWLLSKQNEFEELIDKAQDLVDKIDEEELAESERKYKEWSDNLDEIEDRDEDTADEYNTGEEDL